jgi:acetylornithine deacetylase
MHGTPEARLANCRIDRDPHGMGLDAAAAAGAHVPTILTMLEKLVGFDTTSSKSNLCLIDWMEAYLRRLRFRTQRLYDHSGAKASLLASIGPPNASGYVLSGHTDTVPVEGQAWTRDPFCLHIEEGHAFGRGACDMKGFLSVCLALAPVMARAPLMRQIHLAMSYDEEVGCIGARELCRHLRDSGMHFEACFVGEPTRMQVVVAHKSKRNVRAVITGHPCHSSLAPRGVNAVEWGALLVAEIRRIGDRLARHGTRDQLYEVPHSSAHVGLFRGGTALNLVPDRADVLFEFRTLAQDDADALVADVERFVRRELEPAMRAQHPDASLVLDVYAASPGLETAPDSEVVILAKSLAGRSDHAKAAFMTEAGLFQSVAGIPTVVIGPGSIEQAHKPDEFISLDELAKCAAFVDRLIARCRHATHTDE